MSEPLDPQECRFVPAHEPWSCSVHPAGYRTALDQTECSIVLGEGTLAELGRDIRAYGDYRATQASAQLARQLLAAQERVAALEGRLGAFDRYIVTGVREDEPYFNDPIYHALAFILRHGGIHDPAANAALAARAALPAEPLDPEPKA